MSSSNSTATGTTMSGLTTEAGRTASTGRGRGGQGHSNPRGGRGNGRANPRVRGTGFKGATTEMNGNVFECYNEQTVRRQYAKAVEALKEYA